MFPVLMSIRQRRAHGFHVLSAGMVRWMKPRSTSLLLGTIADIARGKSELLVENALLRLQLIILRRQVKRPTCGKTERFLLVRAARGCSGPGSRPSSLCSRRPCFGFHRELFRFFWKHKSKVDARQPKISPETIALIKEMASKNRRLVSGAHPRRVTQAGYLRVQTNDPEIHEAGSPTSPERAEVGDLPAESRC